MVGTTPSKSPKRGTTASTSPNEHTKDQTVGVYENVTVRGATTTPSPSGTPEDGTPALSVPSTDQQLELTVGGIPEKDPGVVPRGEFSNNIQYLLACVGYAVGLGNIWRFPSIAYDNGGGAFLIPYILVSIFFGLPTLYIECALGQFTQVGPSKAFKFYMPLSQGIGWAMSLISLSIALYYNVIVAWSMIYLGFTVSNNMGSFSSCNNDWNKALNCSDTVKCRENQTHPHFYHGDCYDMSNYTLMMDAYRQEHDGQNVSFVSAPDEYFTYYITQKHHSFGFGYYNLRVAGCLVACWVMTALGLWKGVKWLGKISVVTATVPYVIIVILLIRGVTLEGAWIGIEKYLTKPDFSKIFEAETWKAALTQICFSLSVGQGGMLAMSSYNKRSHKCFKDAVLVMAADSIMSVIGGVAVFSVLGFMAQNSGKDFYQVVPTPLSLAFVAYPEAISHMPVSIVWSLLFFFMIFMLGISTMFGLVEGFITCICDSSTFFRARHTATVFVTCGLCALVGLFFFCSQNGFHFFNIFNEFIGSFSLAVVIVFEIIVVVGVYGPRYFFRDMESQFGKPTSNLGRIFGPTGLLIKLLMSITAPLFAVGVLVITFWDLTKASLMDKIGIQEFPYPSWAIAFGVTLAAIPLSAIPIFAIMNCISTRRSGKGIGSLFRVSDDHPALRYDLEGPASLGDFLWPPLADKTHTSMSRRGSTSTETHSG